MSTAIQTLWARSFLDELARCGVRHLCMAPGSRSTPLVMAAAADGRFRTWVHIDERSAGFFGLGIGKATRSPAGIITTSGTAAANLLPAAIEASQSGVPLLLLTADRPLWLRGGDANQTIEQQGLYGPYVRAFFEAGQSDPRGLRRIRTIACRAYGATLAPDPGPVHVNFAFAKPLEPVEIDESELAALRSVDAVGADGRADGSPMVRITPWSPVLLQGEEERLTELVGSAKRGVIVAGPVPDPSDVGPALCRLATATGFPLLADPLSGARFGPHFDADVVASYHLFLRDDDVRRALEPDLIVRVGTSPTGEGALRYLEDHIGVPQAILAAGSRWADHLWGASTYVRTDLAPFLDRITDRTTKTLAAPDWSALWREMDEAAAIVISQSAESFFEGDVLAAVVKAVPEDTVMFVSNSMPVRDLDAFGGKDTKVVEVYGNRGASGIDGIVSTALGLSAGREGSRIVAVLGDLAFLYDSTGLIAAKKYGLDVVFIVIDNDGGGIFHMLPIAEHEPHFTPFFATPHGLDLGRIADLYGLRYRWADGAAELRSALGSALEVDGPSILVVRTDREVNQRRHEEMREAVCEVVRPIALQEK
jgi:2-succinyl-5-enolpyruvyl-6-hydroxy-3-cyclohexene-1-carboxylate synthase